MLLCCVSQSCYCSVGYYIARDALREHIPAAPWTRPRVPRKSFVSCYVNSAMPAIGTSLKWRAHPRDVVAFRDAQFVLAARSDGHLYLLIRQASDPFSTCLNYQPCAARTHFLSLRTPSAPASFLWGLLFQDCSPHWRTSGPGDITVSRRCLLSFCPHILRCFRTSPTNVLWTIRCL